jgi:hypothetical protein
MKITAILARSAMFPLLNPNDTRKSRHAFRCEYPSHAMSSLRDIFLTLCYYNEIYDLGGVLQETQIVHEWKMTPVFTAMEEVVWTNFVEGSMRDMRSEDLLDHVLTFFVSAMERSITHGRPV